MHNIISGKQSNELTGVTKAGKQCLVLGKIIPKTHLSLIGGKISYVALQLIFHQCSNHCASTVVVLLTAQSIPQTTCHTPWGSDLLHHLSKLFQSTARMH